MYFSIMIFDEDGNQLDQIDFKGTLEEAEAEAQRYMRPGWSYELW